MKNNFKLDDETIRLLAFEFFREAKEKGEWTNEAFEEYKLKVIDDLIHDSHEDSEVIAHQVNTVFYQALYLAQSCSNNNLVVEFFIEKDSIPSELSHILQTLTIKENPFFTKGFISKREDKVDIVDKANLSHDLKLKIYGYLHSTNSPIAVVSYPARDSVKIQVIIADYEGSKMNDGNQACNLVLSVCKEFGLEVTNTKEYQINFK